VGLGHTTSEREHEAAWGVSRWIALTPVWLALRLLALGLPRGHPLQQLPFRGFVLHARERAFWVGVGLYAAFAVWLRLVSSFLSVQGPTFPLSLLFP
jgi:hypothetical protein